MWVYFYISAADFFSFQQGEEVRASEVSIEHDKELCIKADVGSVKLIYDTNRLFVVKNN